MSDNLGICPVCGDVETIGGAVCWRCKEQEMIDNDPNPVGGVDWEHTCPTCHWYLESNGRCINPDCSEDFPAPVDQGPPGDQD